MLKFIAKLASSPNKEEAFTGFISFVLLLLLSKVSVFAQGMPASNWACGDSIGISFNTEPPSYFPCKNSCDLGLTTDLNGNNTSISDTKGKLLFYFQGKFRQSKMVGNEIHSYLTSKIYNFEHDMIENGDSIAGMINAPNAMILSHPEIKNIYYLFTIMRDYFPNIDDMRNYDRRIVKDKIFYHLIDMSANNGRGRVISKNNILKHTGTFWKQTACRHANGKDWWIMTHDSDSSKTFRKYLLTKNGIDTTEYTQDIGYIFDPNYYGLKKDTIPRMQFIGGSDFSYDGSRYIIVTKVRTVELYDFDRCTGCLFKRKDLTDYKFADPRKDKSGEQIEHVIFSKNGKMAYVNLLSCIYQYDLEKGTKVMIDTTRPKLKYGYNPPTHFGVLSHHPFEDKIIVPEFSRWSRRDVDTINIINNPGAEIANINYQRGWLLVPEKKNFCYGFPYYPNYSLGPMVPTYTRTDTLLCRGDSVKLGSDHECPYNYSWVGIKVADSTVKILNYKFDSVGVYKFWRHRFSASQGCTTAVDTFVVMVKTTAPPCVSALEKHSKPKTKVKIYPNPAQEVVMIAANQQILLIRFYDLNGKVVKEEIPDISTQTHESNVQNLPHGIYLLQVETDGGSVSQKVVVER